MQYPLSFRFKIIAIAPQIYVTDDQGKEVCFVKQKLFRLREKVEVFADSSRERLLCTIAADRMLDWSARYTLRDAEGRELGAVGRRGMRSLWKAHYDIFMPDSDQPAYTLHEANPFSKVLDGLFGEVPFLGLLSSYLFHPKYAITSASGEDVMLLSKRPAFFEGRFRLDQLKPVPEADELVIILSCLMMNLLERDRG